MNGAPFPIGQLIITAIKRFPGVVPHLSDATTEALKAAGYDGIRTVMYGAVFGSVFGYLEAGGSVAPFVNRMTTEVARAYTEAVDVAYVAGGGELPIDDETAAWARAQIEAQFNFIDALFQDLKQTRKDGDYDSTAIATARASGYASALDGFFVEAQMRGSKNIVLTWRLGQTEKHCKTCASLNGGSHKISWYIDRDYIPRKSGAAMDCGGWNCDCLLIDRKGNEYTI